MSSVDKVLALREGGNVRRCHTMPHLGEYTVGKHSYDAACLVLALHPEPSAELLKAVMLHDVPERWLGDLPAPAKWYAPGLAKVYGQAEEAVERTWDIGWKLSTVSDHAWLNAVDRVEFWLWTHDQLAFGNQHIAVAKEAVEKWFAENWEQIPTPVQEFINEYRWKRLPEMRSEKHE